MTSLSTPQGTMRDVYVSFPNLQRIQTFTFADGWPFFCGLKCHLPTGSKSFWCKHLGLYPCWSFYKLFWNSLSRYNKILRFISDPFLVISILLIILVGSLRPVTYLYVCLPINVNGTGWWSHVIFLANGDARVMVCKKYGKQETKSKLPQSENCS